MRTVFVKLVDIAPVIDLINLHGALTRADHIGSGALAGLNDAFGTQLGKGNTHNRTRHAEFLS
jgi:hypothetical protein